MPKNFVLVTQYYPPEIGGGSQRSVGFVEELSRLGLKVTVVTPFPSYLMKKEDAKTKLKLFEKSEDNGVTVYRTFVYASDRGKFIKRMLYYLSFTFSSTIVSLFKIRKIDYLLTISPPLFTGITGIILKKIRKVKFIFDIGDLWPESAVQLGFLKNKRVISLAEKLEKAIYSNSDFVNTVTKLTQNKVKNLHPFIKKVLYIPNFVNGALIKKAPKDDSLLKKLGLENKLVVGYAGNIGSAQGLKIMTEAARCTRDNNDIVYLIIGDGIDKPGLEEDIRRNDLKNVILQPPVSREEIIKYISLFDVMAIPLVKNDLFRITIPSKLYESMAAEIPVLLCVDGEARKILESANCGMYVEPENSGMLSEKIMELYKNRKLLEQLGKNGRRRAEEEFDRAKVMQKFYEALNDHE
ncbi:MAG: glycosyltransferase family 4 protein [Ignavibacteria bacterium]|jgi:glycosyltransferase involved in cell wall biosynthesis|nr:glycosyltransferase family 4 protein [Ignavibacteria bacterium]MCU7503120.1 glycosyltransferase family 4 protein [Ignavibacteria bacterium]MCU7518424.1 glycosyltransferase family 4 protein [Ignavibacteria bacterium]